MTFRRVPFVLHLRAALLASVFLLLLGTTGSLMVYGREIDHALNCRHLAGRPASQPLTLTELFTRLEKSHPGYTVTEIEFSHQPDVAYGVYLDPGNGAEGVVLTVDQYTGRVLGDARTIIEFVRSRRTFKYRLYPNRRQRERLQAALDMCPELYNAGLQECRLAWSSHRQGIHDQAQANQLPDIKAVRRFDSRYHSFTYAAVD